MDAFALAPPLAAVGGATDALATLFGVLLAAKVGAELFARLGQPVLVGEILAGVVIGPSVLGLVDPDELLAVFAEIGVILLLFYVGLETRLSDLAAVGRTALAVGLLGVVVPAGGGLALGLALGRDAATVVFLAAALAATSVGVTSAVLVALDRLDHPAGRTIIAAAIVDDILALIVLAAAVGLAADGGFDAVGLATTVGLAVAFVAFVGVGGARLMARFPRALLVPRFDDSPLVPAVLLCLGLAVLAAQIGLAAIIGAFLAGMAIAETSDHAPVEDEVRFLQAFFAPFFFGLIGLQLDLGALGDPGTLALLAVVTAVAVVTKLVAAYAASRPALGHRAALFVGVGMVARGEVGIIVAGVGAAEGVVDAQLFAVIVAMAVLTTVIVGPVLRRVAPDPVPA